MAEAYLITGPNNLQYLGVTRLTASRRLDAHWYDAKRGRSPNHHFYNAMRESGREAFSVRALIVGEWNYLLDIENALIDHFCTRWPQGYNQRDGSLNGKHSDDTRALMSLIKKEQFASDPSYRVRLKAIAQRIWGDPERRKRQSERVAGTKHSDETKAKMSTAQRRNNLSSEYRAAQSERMKQWWAERKAKIT